MDKAILKGREVIPVETTLEWAEWFENASVNGTRWVGRDKVRDIRISTVFLGLNHSWNGGEIWFETMIFGGRHDQYQTRCTTYDDAEKMHQAALKLVKGKCSWRVWLSYLGFRL